ncbi:MAG TPA: multicopper oxidase domain-containing protein [Thermoanaerobaculia bacterium]|jgi:hypothetical protein|nr:multicopper oxidase domain-containing protein [Thermoanaerobaculia bacterium]
MTVYVCKPGVDPGCDMSASRFPTPEEFPPQGTSVIRQEFLDYTGAFVLHCHFLGHEDRGMMLTVQTVCPNNLAKYSATSLTQPECTFGQFVPALPDCSKMPAKMHGMPKSKKQ